MTRSNWNGSANDTNWDNASNWTNGVAGAAYDVTFLASATNGPLVNVDKSSGSLNLASMVSEAGVRYPIGSAALPLTFTCDLIHHFGYGTLHFKSKGNPITGVIVVRSSHPNALVLDSDAGAAAVGWLAAFGGGMTLKSSMAENAIVRLLVSPTDGFLLPKVTTEPAGTKLLQVVSFTGGQIIDARGTTLLFQCGGIYDADGSVYTTSNIYGGRFNANFAGTYPTVRHLGGTVDLLHRNGGQVKAITSYIPNRLAVELRHNPAIHTVTDVIGV